MADDKTTRAYRSPRRAAAAGATRERIVEAALDLLRQGGAQVTLEAVGRAAGVTRPTVYNQFGSRRALLEAVFDRIAKQGPIAKIPEAMTTADPRQALASFIGVFCAFWSSESALFASLETAAAGDAELRESLAARVERRRRGFAALMDRLAADATIDANPVAIAALADLLYVLTSRAAVDGLARGGRGPAEAEAIIQAAALDAVRRTFG